MSTYINRKLETVTFDYIYQNVQAFYWSWLQLCKVAKETN